MKQRTAILLERICDDINLLAIGIMFGMFLGGYKGIWMLVLAVIAAACFFGAWYFSTKGTKRANQYTR